MEKKLEERKRSGSFKAEVERQTGTKADGQTETVKIGSAEKENTGLSPGGVGNEALTLRRSLQTEVDHQRKTIKCESSPYRSLCIAYRQTQAEAERW